MLFWLLNITHTDGLILCQGQCYPFIYSVHQDAGKPKAYPRTLEIHKTG